jgi:predicted nucleic acid-binding protein
MTTITIRADKRTEKLISKMIELGIAKSKNEAVNLLIKYGRAETERKIREEEEVQRLVDKWLEEGFPYEGLDTSDLREEGMSSYYINTNVILSLVEKDANYQRALRIRGFRDLITVEVIVRELNFFYSRKIKREIEAKVATKYALIASNVRVVEIDANKLIRKAKELSLTLHLKTLDVLQIASALLSGSSFFVTFDRDIVKKKELIKEKTGL